MELILYSKPDCHLCEGLQEKLAKIETLDLKLEIRDITTRQEWFDAYQYEVPVLFQKVAEQETLIPRPSPRASVSQLAKILSKYQ
ncbi:MAG: glutaredoxin family protein [Prochloraceae cyanobacterium]|nr:glutaredoxin family protein [Prochloraceae cyanobacterium]